MLCPGTESMQVAMRDEILDRWTREHGPYSRSFDQDLKNHVIVSEPNSHFRLRDILLWHWPTAFTFHNP